MSGMMIVFYLKCFCQAAACLKLSPCRNSCLLWSFITRMETFVNCIKLSECRNAEHRFKRKVHRWFYVSVIIAVFNITITILTTIVTVPDITKVIAKPFSATTSVVISKHILNIFATGAWLLPTALCGVLTQSLSYLFDEFYRYLDTRIQGGLSLKNYIEEIRERYVTLTAMCSDLDEMLANIIACSYLTDITLVCLILRNTIVFIYRNMGQNICLCLVDPSYIYFDDVIIFLVATH